MVKILIFQENECYNSEDWFINNFSFKKIKDDGLEYSLVEMKNKEDIFDMIGLYIKPDDKSIMNITDLYYDNDYVYQTIYKSCTDTKISTYNGLGSQLTRSQSVDGSMILIKRLIISNEHPYEDFTFDDLYKLIKHTFVHNAVIVNPNDKIEDFPYMNDVLESMVNNPETYETIRYHEYKFLDYVMVFYCNISVEQIPENLNKIASMIYRKKIYGKVFITLLDNNDEHPQHLDIHGDLIMQIYHLHAIEKEIDHEKYKKSFDLQNQESFPQINYDPNFFSIINKEFQKYKDFQHKTDINKFNDVLNNIK
jgi:hypothetical protein